jgi:release factor glutamine methyltransferase
MYGPDEAGSIAWLVIGFVCKINRSQFLNNKNSELSEEVLSALYVILTDLRKGIPVQYVLGETEFYGSLLNVNPSVLIPRPETEELVDWVLKDAKAGKYGSTDLKVLDIGTGSGCIPITIGKYLSNSNVSAIDISIEALETARKNARSNNVEVNFMHDDILQPHTSASNYSIIISNPPYVRLSEKGQMHTNVLDHEPHKALFVPDDDALVFYRAIADFALIHLEENGALYLEINENLGPETVLLLQSKGFSRVELRKDLRDMDRMVKAQIS